MACDCSALRRIRRCAVLGLAAILPVLQVGAAVAQEATADAVQVRPRPEYDPIGFELGQLFTDTASVLTGRSTEETAAPDGVLSSFVVFPKLALDVVHTDNVFRTSTNEKSDLITVVRPSVTIASDWENHSLTFLTEGAIGRYQRNPLEDYEDFKLEASSRIDIDEFDSMSLLGSGEKTHEPRGELDDPGSSFGPTFVDIYKFGAGYSHQVPDGILFSPQFSFSRYRYKNNGSINNSDRFHDDYNYSMRLGYEFVPGTTLFVQPSYTANKYRQRFDRNGFIRDAQTYEFLAGVTWDASSVTFLDAGVGFLGTRFDEPTFTDETRPTANVRLTWNATPLVTLRSALSRNFSPSASNGIAGTLDTNFITSVDWEAMYNVILGLEYTYKLEELIDSTPPLSRTANQISVSGRWLINENFFANTGISHESRSGDLPGDRLRETKLILTLGTQL
jgi:hypothetical protein